MIASSPCVNRIFAGPPAVSAGANLIVSAPGTRFAAKIASRSDVTPSLKSTVSESVVTVTTASSRRSSSGSSRSCADGRASGPAMIEIAANDCVRSTAGRSCASSCVTWSVPPKRRK